MTSLCDPQTTMLVYHPDMAAALPTSSLRSRPIDPSSFFRLNEEIALELARLEREGHLTRVQALLEEAGAELLVSSVRADAGLEELLGCLRPGRSPEVAPLPRALPPSATTPREACDCGPGDGEASSVVDATARAGWDHEHYLATRSRFAVVYPDGSAAEVYMPDHLCPSCWNEELNVLDSCERVCDACGFRW